NAVFAVRLDEHFDAVRELREDVEVGGDVVFVVDGRPALFELHRMRGRPFDRDRTRVALPDGPLSDIDVMRAPVGHLAAGVFVPPAELVMAATRDVVD